MSILHETIHELRQRTPEERHAMASTISVGIVVVLAIFWAFFFFRGLAAAKPAATPQSEDALGLNQLKAATAELRQGYQDVLNTQAAAAAAAYKAGNIQASTTVGATAEETPQDVFGGDAGVAETTSP